MGTGVSAAGGRAGGRERHARVYRLQAEVRRTCKELGAH